MAKDKLTDYSATNGSNTDVGGINIDEGMLPSAVNNALREILTHLKNFASGTDGIDVLSLADDDASAAMKLQAPASVTSDTTLTLPDGDGADGQALITNGSGTLAWAYPYGNRNLLINGSASVNQRGDATGVTATAYKGPDRFQTTAVSAGTWSISQSSTAPTGFSNSIKFDCTTANASLGATSELGIGQIIEAQDLQHLNYGASGAQSLTLSFWVRSNKTGTYAIWFYEYDGARQRGANYTISSADTWEHKTVTIEGDTSGTINDDNGQGLLVRWILAAGSNYTSGTAASAWEAYTAANSFVGQSVNLADSTSNEWYITGVQLEVGEQATPFEHRSFADELARCERYFWKTYNYSVAPGSVSTASHLLGSPDADQNYFTLAVPHVQMRSSPTRVIYNPSTGTVSQMRADSTNHTASISGTDVHGGGAIFAQNSLIGKSNFVKAHLTMDAEL